MVLQRSTSPIESVLEHVDAQGLIDLASGMIRFPSQIPNEGPLGEFLAAEMRKLGCFDEVMLQPVVPGRANVIGVVRGSGGGPTVLLNGHMDIPAAMGAWTRDPYEPSVEGGWLYGLGITDMKAAVACQIKAAEAFARARLSLPGDLVVTAVIHHNVCGLGTKFFLDSWDRPIHAAINGEPTDLKVQVAHGGAWQFEIVTRGKAAHNSRQEEGVHAIDKMLAILRELDASKLTYDRSRALEGLPRIVVGMIEGGRSPSRTADACLVRGDIRISFGMTQETLKADLQRVIDSVRAHDPGLEAEVRGLVYQRPFRIDPEAPIVRTVRRAHADVAGSEAVVSAGLPVAGYVTDSSDLVRAGIPTVVYGPGDWRVDPDERVRVADLVTATKVYALAAARFMAEATPEA